MFRNQVLLMCSFIPMNTHTHSLSTTLYKINAQQYKGRGNSLQYESARINILYNLHFYNVQVKSWETPNLHLVNFHNFGKLGCPARRHLHTVVARLSNSSFTSSHVFAGSLFVWSQTPKPCIPAHTQSRLPTLDKRPNRVDNT